VNWPGIIKHAGDSELSYVNEQSEWDNDADLHLPEYAAADYLVDSSGAIFGLTKRSNHQVKPEPTGETSTLAEILGLVKAHASLSGYCCSSGLYAPSVHAAIDIVKSMNAA